MKKLFVLFLLLPLFLSAAFTASGTAGAAGTLTQISTSHSWYLKNAIYTNEAYRANKIYFDITYTVGDETSVAFNIGFLYSDATPAVANISYFPESDSSGQLSIMSRTMLKSTGTRRYTVSVEVPDRATFTVITFAATGGTPTGTIVAYGFSNQFN
jgi:hypothetical protein